MFRILEAKVGIPGHLQPLQVNHVPRGHKRPKALKAVSRSLQRFRAPSCATWATLHSVCLRAAGRVGLFADAGRIEVAQQ